MNEFAINVNLCIDDFVVTLEALELAIKSPNTTMDQIEGIMVLHKKYKAAIENFKQTGENI